MDGISRDSLRQPFDSDLPITDQPGLVRTKWERSVVSLRDAVNKNALSRVWLGVHWRFDAFAAEDTLEVDAEGKFAVEEDGSTKYKPAGEIRYSTRKKRSDRDG